MEWEIVISLSVNFVFYINIHNEKQLYLSFVCVCVLGEVKFTIYQTIIQQGDNYNYYFLQTKDKRIFIFNE